MITANGDFLTNIDPDDNYFNNLPNSAGAIQSKFLSVSEFQTFQQNIHDSILIINYNIRSYRANSDYFFSMFEEGQLPDICVFTETWFKADTVQDLHS